MPARQFKFKVFAPEIGQAGSFTVTIQVPFTEPEDAKDVLAYIHGTQLKGDFMNGWMRENTPGYGVEVRGGPRPVFTEKGNRQSPVTAYEQDFRVTRGI